ncbi:hypothetical protein ACVXZY_01755 [Staphylococcus aureus]
MGGCPSVTMDACALQKFDFCNNISHFSTLFCYMEQPIERYKFAFEKI